ncbi:MAG: FkbM family methyltransferase [Alphaproteobacteria bacterium]|nr:FkbM family methyltransferase [Alphaproteobacteria bacterium]
MARKKRLIEVEAIFGRLLAFPDDLITKQIVKFGAHTRPELAMLLSVTQPGDLVFDLGAHIGTFAIPLAQKVGSAGRVVAVEAFPRTFRVLQRNLRRNGVDHITTAVNALIGPKGLSFVAVRDKRNTGGTRFDTVETLDGHTDIERLGIDALCAAYFPPRVIKIDIEGFEVLVLSASQVVPDLKPVLYTEVSARSLCRMGNSIAELDALLRGWGYRLFRNVAPRNGPTDHFEIQELASLTEGGGFFDVLAIHATDQRLWA